MKKGIYIVIMKIIRINGAPTVVAWRVAWVCAGTAVPLNGMVCTDTTRGGSVAHDMRMRTHVRAGLCGIVGTYLRCHGLRCRSSSRRPGHGRPDSRSFCVSPCRRLRIRHETLEGIVRTFGNCPHGLRDWKREGLTACTHVGCALARKAAKPASANVVSGWLRSSEMAMTNAFKTARRIPEREHPLETTICRGMMQKSPLRAAR